MKITSAQFFKGFTNSIDASKESLLQYAFIGRSNVGKSSLINALTKNKKLANTSSFPGRTQQINFFLINDTFHLVDLPGYGYAKMGAQQSHTMMNLVEDYLFGDVPTLKKVVVVVDAVVGPTEADLGMIRSLEHAGRDVVIALNKIDKLKQSEKSKQMKKIESMLMGSTFIPVSAEKKQGLEDLMNEVFGK